MRRTLAIALAAGLLLLGGCGRGRAHQADRPAPPAPAAVTTAPAAPGTTGAADSVGDKSDKSDIDTLLDQAGQQLSSEAQPADDED